MLYSSVFSLFWQTNIDISLATMNLEMQYVFVLPKVVCHGMILVCAVWWTTSTRWNENSISKSWRCLSSLTAVDAVWQNSSTCSDLLDLAYWFSRLICIRLSLSFHSSSRVVMPISSDFSVSCTLFFWMSVVFCLVCLYQVFYRKVI